MGAGRLIDEVVRAQTRTAGRCARLLSGVHDLGAERSDVGLASSSIELEGASTWPWGDPLRRLSGRLSCWRATADAAGARLDGLAAALLSEAEAALWNSLKAWNRRREWLLGRLAAKAAVLQLSGAGGGGAAQWSSIEILPDARGRPCCRRDGRAVDTSGISISHTAGQAAALVWDSEVGRAFGLDLEPGGKRRPFLEGAAVLRPSERQLLPEGEARGEWPTRFWCAKEAAAKAMGGGLQGSPRAFCIVAVEPVSGDVRITREMSGSARGTNAAFVRTGEEDGYVYAVAACGRTD